MKGTVLLEWMLMPVRLLQTLVLLVLHLWCDCYEFPFFHLTHALLTDVLGMTFS